MRGGAGERRRAEAVGLGAWQEPLEAAGRDRAAGTREASGPGLGLGQVESPLLFFPGIVAKDWAAA